MTGDSMATPASHGREHTIANGVCVDLKSPGKSQRKSLKSAAEGSYQVSISRGRVSRKRKLAKVADPAPPDATSKFLPKRSGHLAKISSTKALVKCDSKLLSAPEDCKASESYQKFLGRGTTSETNLDNVRQSRENVGFVEKVGTRSQRSLSLNEVSSSTGVNSLKPSSSVISSEEKNALAEDERLGIHKKQRGRRRKDEGSNVDEKTRIKRKVKNLVNRIRLEQNLIDAYAGEGWKGNSREKIRPEKELQRADMEILRCKLAIRDLIHDLHNLGLEGSLEESAFDDDGQIFHEEIFCAKCKSQEAFIDNDIILCDGACDRGFHQECLEPPLATADIPPGDEGWLCPVCDSKVECLNYINGYLGTEFQIEDQWEKIFAAAAGYNIGSNAMGEDWPSEDSEDDDYDPEIKATEDENKEKHSGDAEYKCVCEDSLSTECDDVSSRSESSREDGSQFSVSSVDEVRHRDRRFERGCQKGESVADIPNTGHDADISLCNFTDENESTLILGKRRRKPVDYKKLHDELFGKDTDDDVLSEDEEWGPGRRGRRISEGLNGYGKSEQNGSFLKRDQKHTQRKSLVVQSYDGNELSAIKYCDGQQTDNIKSRRLPDTVVEMLRQEFERGTCFPTRAYKQTLAQNLGISFQQVCSWFKNARHSLKLGAGQSSLTLALQKTDATAKGMSRAAGQVDEMEVTNGLLVEKLDEVHLRLQYLKQTLEAMVVESHAGFESLVSKEHGHVGNFEAGIMKSQAKSKPILYIPVAEVVEKEPGLPLGN